MAERGARHHRQGHRADGTDRPGMDSGARRQDVKGGKTRESITKRNERVGQMKDKDQPIGDRAIAGPAREPDSVKHTRDQQHGPGEFRRRDRNPCREREHA